MNASGIYIPTEAAYTYTADIPTSFYSQYQSNVQYMVNGNLFTNEGDSGHFVERDQDGNTVWEYLNPSGIKWSGSPRQFPGGSAVFTATRLPVDHPAFEGKDLTPQGVIELDSDIRTVRFIAGWKMVCERKYLMLFTIANWIYSKLLLD